MSVVRQKMHHSVCPVEAFSVISNRHSSARKYNSLSRFEEMYAAEDIIRSNSNRRMKHQTIIYIKNVSPH